MASLVEPSSKYAEIEGESLHLRGRVTAPDGREQIDVFLIGAAELSSAYELGKALAALELRKGVARLLEIIH